MTSGDSGRSGFGKDWPGEAQADPGDPAKFAATPEAIAAARQPALKRRLWWIVSVVVSLALGAGASYLVTKDWSLNDYREGVAASTSSQAKMLPPPNLYCPDSNSDEGRKAIRNKPIVVIDEPPVQRVVVMRRAVVVIVKADLTGDLVVCGNDARVVFESSPRPGARVLVRGGTDTGSNTAGPMVLTVDDATVDPARVWFTNNKPQIVNCSSQTNGSVRSCASYYVSTLPSPAVSSSPSSPSPSPSATR